MDSLIAQKIKLPGDIEIEGPPEIETAFGGEVTIASIISRLLPVILAFAGIILFIMLLWGGYDLMFSGGDPQKAQSARQKVTAAIIGFVIVFSAFILTQALNFMLGLNEVPTI